jgi:hypothetical protein
VRVYLKNTRDWLHGLHHNLHLIYNIWGANQTYLMMWDDFLKNIRGDGRVVLKTFPPTVILRRLRSDNCEPNGKTFPRTVILPRLRSDNCEPNGHTCRQDAPTSLGLAESFAFDSPSFPFPWSSPERARRRQTSEALSASRAVAAVAVVFFPLADCC